MESARVVILEDDFYARDAMAQRLQRDDTIRVVGEANSPSQAFEMLENPDLSANFLLVDLDFPDQHGQIFSLIEDVRRKHSALKILCLSLLPSSNYLRRTLAIGADGLIQKNQCADGLGLGIDHCMQGKFVTTRDVARLITGEQINRDFFVIPQVKLPSEMANHLKRVAYLRYVRGLSSDQIAEDLVLSKNTVNDYLKQIKAILRIASRRNLLTRGFMVVTRLLWREE